MSSGKRIVHIFYGSFQHLNPTIIESIEETSQFSHYYVIYLKENDGYHLLNKTNEDKYKFYHRMLASINGNYLLTESFMEILLLLIKQRTPFIMHSDNLQRNIAFSCLLFWLPSAWVCWGSYPNLSNTKIKIIGNIKNMLKKILLNSFSQVVCLMNPDSDNLELLYTRKGIQTLPYASSKKFDDLYPENILFCAEHQNKVLIGNSGHYVKNYINVLENLERFSSAIYVTCMVNYALIKNDDYSRLKQKGYSYFRDRFFADEQFYNQAEYADYIHSFGIYICNVKHQTGLGVINNCLRSGVKIYLTGHNLQWISSMGYIVYDYNDLFYISLEEFLQPLSHDEKLFNFNNYLRLRIQQAKDWDSFYNEFIQSSI